MLAVEKTSRRGASGLTPPIYLDHHATTPCDARVVAAMLPYFTEEFGNPASRSHAFGWRAAEAVEQAREQVAAAIGAAPRELIFTSGATESNNLALLGCLRAARPRRDHVITSVIEHPSILDPCRALEHEGLRVTYVRVDRDGLIDLDALERALDERTALVSIGSANSEIGVLQPIAEISRLARERGILLHSDAAQAVGKIPLDVSELGVDLLSFSAHKLYGPKGIGALYVRRRRPSIAIEPLVHGGGQERGLRSGTLPVPLCVGFGRACELALEALPSESVRLRDLRDRLWATLSAELEAVHLNGHAERRLPGNLNVSFEGVEGEALMLGLPDLALSSGSACTSATREPSHVLRALGLGADRALCSLRIGLGRFTTQEEVDEAGRQIVAHVKRLREMSPVWQDRRRGSAAKQTG
jgi:cysteine desulfurase